MSTFLLGLRFFDNKIEKSLNGLVPNELVHSTSGKGFLFISDSIQNIHRIDHHFEVRTISTNFESIEYIQASQTTQQILAAGKTGSTYSIIIEDTENFSEQNDSYMYRVANSFNLLTKSKATEPASLFCSSSSLSYIAFKTSLNEILIFKAPFSEKNKPFQQFTVSNNVEKLLITENGNLFLISHDSISLHSVSSKNQTIIDNQGCNPDFAFLTKNGGIGFFRDKNVFFYNIQSNGQIKKDVTDLSAEGTDSPVSIGALGSYFYITYPYKIQDSVQRLKVIDPNYNVRAFQQNLTKPLKFVEMQWGALIMVQSDKRVLMFSEVDDQVKVDRFCQKNLFKLALTIANELHLGEEVIANIHKLQGDFFYSAAKFEDAIDEYIQTIGFVESSHVIQKFVEPHHAQNLMKYLDALQKRKLASKQHTTLLFNCYTKIRATGLLEEAVAKFVKAAQRGEEPNFDVETAVDVMKRNNYQKQAEELAKAYGHHKLYMQLLYENQDYKHILEYMETLPGELVLSTLTEYGSEIMDNYEEGREELTKFAVKCCTVGIENHKKRKSTHTIIDPNNLSMIFVNNNEMYFDFLYQIFQSNPDNLSDMIWNILIEMSLRSNSSKTMELLQYPNAKYSSEQVLVYLTGFNHSEGKIYIYEKLGLYALILQESPPEKCLEICLKFGDKDKTLWSDALVKLSVSNLSDEKILSQFLDEVQKHDALPFLTILKVLKGTKKSFSTILPVVQSVFKKEQQLLHQAQNKIDDYNKKAEENKTVIQNLSTQNFAINQTKCAKCGQDIDFESNHFMCGHSFHITCLGDSDTFCPICRNKFEKIVVEKVNKMEAARKQENVQSKLSQEIDGFEFLLKQVENSLFASGINLMALNQDDEELNEAKELLQRMSTNT
ncbi:vacuolar protein sorting-associated protein 11 [Histomonas meleagridis]|uniref:vacuolar protein sorting-associated protein 11-like n=1 Tax=Histomonas meleagridis TaxID=135588 RepID=UPI00355AC857|nr:vacuolar protein sorting-associated protein 11 [Histomonas meleagridis]KAH0803170.1 vacuolar protein sorting-associated protein 11-like [Histomonas meleagridis]